MVCLEASIEILIKTTPINPSSTFEINKPMSKFLGASIESYSTNSASYSVLHSCLSLAFTFLFLFSCPILLSPSFLPFSSEAQMFSTIQCQQLSQSMSLSCLRYHSTTTSSAIVCVLPYLWGSGGSYQINRTHLNTGNFTRYTFSFKKNLFSIACTWILSTILTLSCFTCFPPLYLWGGHFSSVFSFLLVQTILRVTECVIKDTERTCRRHIQILEPTRKIQMKSHSEKEGVRTSLRPVENNRQHKDWQEVKARMKLWEIAWGPEITTSASPTDEEVVGKDPGPESMFFIVFQFWYFC